MGKKSIRATAFIPLGSGNAMSAVIVPQEH
jgi:hypothetical protein